jgi:hypothetical protein
VALINSVGNFCGGFIGPPIVQASLERGLLIAAALAVAGIAMMLVMPLRLKR